MSYLHVKKSREKAKRIDGTVAPYDYCGNKRKALIRDNYTCQLCDKTKDEVNIAIHHIDGNGTSKPPKEQNNTLDNLVTLCSKCHTKVEISRRGHPPGRSLKEMGVWSKLAEKCLACGTKKKKHAQSGL